MDDTPSAPISHRERDVDLVDVQLQNAATWNVLDNAIQLRELAVRLHGAAVGLTPFAIGLLDSEVVLYSGCAGIAFLSVVSFLTFRNLDVLRLLQFRLAVEEGRARVRLRAGQRTYATERSYRPPTLRRQRDPMGITTRSMLGVTAFDMTLLGVVAGLAMSNRSSDATQVATAISCGVAGAVAAFGMWTLAMRNAEARELALSTEIESHADETRSVAEGIALRRCTPRED